MCEFVRGHRVDFRIAQLIFRSPGKRDHPRKGKGEGVCLVPLQTADPRQGLAGTLRCLLDQTLQEETATDQKLSQLGESQANLKAA